MFRVPLPSVEGTFLMKNILKDIDKFGNERPWKEKKIANLTYAEYLRVLAFKKAHNVKECGNILTFRKTAERSSQGHLKLYQTWFCHGRLCPMCNWRRRIKQSSELKQILSEAVKKEPKGRFIFLTLTEKNADSKDLKQALREMTKAFTKLVNYKKVKQNLLGYVRSTEITVNDERNDYHQHMHAILFVKANYFNNAYISQKEWVRFYQRARKLDYAPSVRVEVIKPNKEKGKNSLVASAYETAKYQVKDSDVITGETERDLKVVEVLENALKGTRAIAFGGLLKKIRHELGFDSKEKEEDLINADETTGETAVDEVIAKWDNVRKNYFWL